MVSRIVRCRSGRSAAPPVSSGRRGASCAASASGGSTLSQPTASSIASGSPSSRRHSSATAGRIRLRQRKVSPHLRGPLHEEADRGHIGHPVGRSLDTLGCGRGGQWRHRELAFAAQTQSLPARGEDGQAADMPPADRPPAARRRGGARRCRGRAPSAGPSAAASGAASGSAASRRRARGRWPRRRGSRRLRGRGDMGQLDPGDAVRECLRDRLGRGDGQTRLADPARAGQRQQTGAAGSQGEGDLRDLALAADEARRRPRR